MITVKKNSLLVLGLIALAISSCKKKDAPPPVLPALTTSAATNIGWDTAHAGGNITSNGNATIIEAGILLSKTNTVPTLADTKVITNASGGSFTVILSRLEPTTQYYIRAFATNSVGTAYGEALTFTTGAEAVTFMYNGASVSYGIIISTVTGKKWLDRNLGAPGVPTSVSNFQNYGHLFQWGRPADGHQVVNRTGPNDADATGSALSSVTPPYELSSTDVPGHNKFIVSKDDPLDWRAPQNTGLWQGVNGVNNPCPTGWRIPTSDEWAAETIADLSDGFTKLKLTYTGFRVADPSLAAVPATSMSSSTAGGYYQTSTVQDTKSIRIRFNTSSYSAGLGNRAGAYAVRCIKN